MSVAQCCLTFLPEGHAWYYDQICHLNRYRSIILTQERIHEDLFPFDKVFVLPKYSSLNEALDTDARDVFRVFNDQLKSVADREDIQLLHAHGGVAGIVFLPAALSCSLPIVTSFTGYDVSMLIDDYKYLLSLRMLFENGILFTVLADEMQERVKRLGCPPEKIRLVRRGIDLLKFPFQPKIPPEPGQPMLILTAARLTEKKGIPDLIEAFSGLIHEAENVRLRIIGDGELWDEIATKIEELGIAQWVEMLGWQPRTEIARQMSLCHIFCLPSCTAEDGDVEGIPNALKEAMASGMPVISTYHAGIPELINDGVNGMLVPEHDVKGLQKRMKYLLDHPECWPGMGRCARAEIEAHYDVSRQADLMETVYDQAIAHQ